MSETVQLALIAAIFAAIPSTIAAVVAGYIAYRKAATLTQKITDMHTDQTVIAQDVKRVEDATNGMKKELVMVNRSDATQIERARGLAQTTAENEAAKSSFVERRHPAPAPQVAVPVIDAIPEAPEIHYVIRDGKLVEVIKP